MSDPALHPCFLGPYGENDALLERLLVEFLRDHVYWRRNLHPEDPPAIPTGAAQQPSFLAFEARMRRELHSLSAALKRSVPFHSPRYLGHMVSDLLLPGLAAYMLTLPYNPNNVSEEAAPVTIDLELRAGRQLARMLGFNDDPERADSAHGHLCSGGTVANYQGLRLALALKAFPVALRAVAPPELTLPEDDWSAFNQTPAQATELLVQWQGFLRALPESERRVWRERLEAERLERLGLTGFFARHPELETPCVLAPLTAHYSWSKGVKLLGLGRDQLLTVPERGMRLNLDALETMLANLLRQRRPVLLVVPILGSTEFGTIDPVDGVVDARERWARRGLGFAVHVDGAWGGYLASLFRDEHGGLRPLAAMQSEHEGFPSPEVHAAYAAIGQADSVTVDPHKLGYIAYGAGAFVAGDQRGLALLGESADYVFDDSADDGAQAQARQLGRYILEGSKPGAAAAAVYVSHRVLPLDHLHFGRLLAQGIVAAKRFRAGADDFASRLTGCVHVCVPFEPDSNLITLALNPVGNPSVPQMNRFLRRLHERLRADVLAPVQTRQFFGSVTTLRPEALGSADTTRLLAALDLDPASLQGSGDGSRLVILRHTLMNPYLIDEENGISYIDRYFAHLERELRGLIELPELSGHS